MTPGFLEPPDHITHTMLSMMDCDLKFKFAATLPKGPAAPFMMRGQRLHEAAETFLLTGDHREALKKTADRDEERAYRKLSSYLEQIRPDVHSTELVLERTDPEGFKATGRLDVILLCGELIDFKFTLRKWTEEKAEKYGWTQADIYMWMVQGLPEGSVPRSTGMRYIVVPQNEDPLETHWLQSYDEQRIQDNKQRWKSCLEQIQSLFLFDLFRPTTNTRSCKWCSYNAVCPTGRRVVK